MYWRNWAKHDIGKNGNVTVKVGPLVCQEDLKIVVDGSLHSWNFGFYEKISWYPWYNIGVVFDVLLNRTATNVTDCKTLVEILDISDEAKNQTFFKVSVCYTNLTAVYNVNGNMTSVDFDFSTIRATKVFCSLGCVTEPTSNKVHVTITEDSLHVKNDDFRDTKYFPKRIKYQRNTANPTKSKVTVYGDFENSYDFIDIWDFRIQNHYNWWK